MWLIKIWKSAAFDFILLGCELNCSSLLPNAAHLQEQQIDGIRTLQMRQWVWALNPFPAEEVPGRRVTKRDLGSWVPVRHHQIIVAGGLLPVTPNNKHEGHHPSVNCAAEGQRLKQRYM